ncbi:MULTISPECIES: DUF4269 domain-containing protein [unclassified Rhizobium]|uniref:DUF4269 domain-containing protein n=1 Tax=unclassified Rhizobium TaxID=2613769 RepID=UPI00084BCA5E|nr:MULTISPECIES: DUF4269 domain-containing protein [unclassified Rhizobium]OEC95103.1 phage capsid protein [Rhizobium sp. YK2]QYA16029.1 DUF4269 domain-containing protein [Rhizobium sp. AB2/73]UEQ84572.1 DUF4269 domain-containing protein [Rhizobium sp. AB2/73]
MKRPYFMEALRRINLLETLAPFDPHVAGTPPLGLDLPTSDIDVLCYAPDPQVFTQTVWDAYSTCDGFSVRQWTGRERPIIAVFAAADWTFELFGQALPVPEQHGWKHFQVEHRLLGIGGSRFRAAVMQLRDGGMKTEPAFAATLSLETCDPYEALFEMAGWPDEALAALLQERGF